jgi:hypothetical protein
MVRCATLRDSCSVAAHQASTSRAGESSYREANLRSAIFRDDAPRCKEADNPRRTDWNRFPVGLDDKVRIGGRFVGIGNSGEERNFSGEGTLVQSLDVAVDQRIQLCFEIDLDEVDVVARGHPANFISGFGVGRNRRRNDEHLVACEQARDKANPANVGVAILLGEAKAFRKVTANFVTIQDLNWPNATDVRGNRVRQSTFPRT